MTKDYKKTANNDSQSSNYGWMFSGIAIGLLVGLGMYFYSNHEASQDDGQTGSTPETTTAFGESDSFSVNDEAGEVSEEPDPISVVIESAREEQQDRKRASFSYYAVLPNLELDVDVTPSEKDSPVKKEALEKLVLKPGSHLLQIASFKSEGSARRVQGELVGQGLETHIEKRLIKGKNWYRLFAGPTDEQSDISHWKSLVEKAGFKPLIVKIQ